MKLIAPLLALLAGFALGYLIFERDEPAAEVEHAPILIRADIEPLKLASEADPNSSDAFEISEEWLVSLEDLSPIQQSSAFSQALASIPIERYQEFHEMFLESEASLNWQFLNLMQKQWTDLDPRGLLAYAETLPMNNDRGLRSQALRAWAKKDFEAAWDYFAAMPKGQYRNNLSHQILRSGATKQPERVLQLMNAEPALGRRDTWIYNNVFQSIAKESPDRARQLAAGMPVGSGKVAALQGVLAHLYSDDPIAAKAWLDTLPEDSSVFRAKRDLNRNHHQLDFQKARELLQAEMEPSKRREMLQQLNYHGLTQNKSFDEIVEVYDWLDANSTGRVVRDRIGQFVNAMVEVDRDRAVAFVLEMPPGDARLNSLAAISSQIAQSDPMAAYEFSNSLEYADERERALSNMSYQITRDGPEAAVAMLAQIGEPFLEKRLAGQIVQEWAGYDLAAATDWMYSLEDKGAFENAQRQLVQTWAKDDVTSAFEYIDSQVEPDKQARFYRNIIDNVSYQNPELAVAWLEKLPEIEEDELTNIYSSIANGYTNLNSMEASKWVATLDAGAPRDNAVQSLANNIARSDPDSSLIWAASVDDKDIRKNTMRNTVREWIKRDLDTAFEAVKDASIEAEEKEPLFKLIDKARKKETSGMQNDTYYVQDPFATRF